MTNEALLELSFSNINYLQNEINRIDSSFPLSALNLYTWKYYDSKVYFRVEDKVIYLYLFNNWEDQNSNSNITVISPIVSKYEKTLIKEYYLKSLSLIESDLKKCKYCGELQFGTFNQNDFNIFKKIELLDTFNSAYLYPTEQLKYMAGKKMQKKRNFINFYKKNYESESRIEKFNPELKQEIIDFCSKVSIDKENQETREYEIDALKKILEFNPNSSYGSTLFYKNKIVGFTYGFINNDKYEIFIEKGDKELKGIYQYLLSKNLEINNIQTKLVDRQDDMYSENLAQSKQSYKPSEVIKMYFFKAFKNILA
ncbi:DUF2156 domain-containing protein [Malacoplasma penetrans]|nr:phosphatidylglycerol lysyltransferase domain-containing protein [Malacoplasma penetrans]RXY97091.1 DUF2156 domain-containing protein [Malacoplasma penetrans]